MEGSIREIAGVVAVFFLGLIVLAPVAAFSLRFALKPFRESLQRRDPQLVRQLEQVQGEVEALRASVQKLEEGQAFATALLSNPSRD